jgi:hypothetical protein
MEGAFSEGPHGRKEEHKIVVGKSKETILKTWSYMREQYEVGSKRNGVWGL